MPAYVCRSTACAARTAYSSSLLIACHLSCQALIVDEAHRLKNQKSATRLALQEMSYKWLLMLSGTPVQNNMKELQVSGPDRYAHAASMQGNGKV
jgi:superfamily II DNA or RNA helicase